MMVKPVEQRWLDDCQACNLQRAILCIKTEVSVTGHFRRRAEEESRATHSCDTCQNCGKAEIESRKRFLSGIFGRLSAQNFPVESTDPLLGGGQNRAGS